MARYVMLFGVMACLTGCQGQAPSMNLLAPYGPTRIPPPPTGNFQQPEKYYQPSVQPTVPSPPTSSGISTEPLSLAPHNKPTVASTAATTHAVTVGPPIPDEKKEGRGTGSDGVHLVSATTPPTTERPLRIVESGARGEDHVELNGMRINDATKPREPNRLIPEEHAIEISQLPPAVPSPELTLEVPGTRLRTNSQSPQPHSARPAPQKSSSDDGWRIRNDRRPAIRVAGR